VSLNLCPRRPVHRAAIYTVLLAVTLCGAPAWAQVQSMLPVTPGPVNLELRFGSGKTQFHLGEVIPVELKFSSSEHRKYSVGEDCSPRQSYQFHAPSQFRDRAGEMEAAQMMDFGNCHGFTSEIDLAAEPFVVKKVLNEWFRIDTPGKYRVSATSTRLGFPIDSELAELEILPSDPAWEQSELQRANSLIAHSDGGEREEGCRVLRYLGTQAAEVEMARQEGEPSRCNFDLALINAVNRRVVIAELEKRLAEPDLAVAWNFLRVLSFLWFYQEHPELYPGSKTASGPFQPADPWLWRQGLFDAEVRSAKTLSNSLALKTPEARSVSIGTLLTFSESIAASSVPAGLFAQVEQEVPTAFAKLPDRSRGYALQHEWDALKLPGMLPVLQTAVEQAGWFGPSGIAIRRLFDLSPGAGRTAILALLKLPGTDPRFLSLGKYADRDRIIESLGILPDREIPELDNALLAHLQASPDDSALEISAGMVRRYSTAAIAGSLQTWFSGRIGKMPCGAEANLLDYFLRNRPEQGAAMLRAAMQADDSSCQVLHHLAGVRYSPEVEREALAALDDTRTAVVQEALQVLQHDGSPATRKPLLEHFAKWHAAWVGHESELDAPSGQDQVKVERAYETALGAAQSWVTTKPDWQVLTDYCVTSVCKGLTQTMGIIESSPRSYPTILIWKPGGDDLNEYYSFGEGDPQNSMERLRIKMMEFQKGTQFKLETRIPEGESVQRVYMELKPWAAQHGFGLELYP
jgi:hypothetical protein